MSINKTNGKSEDCPVYTVTVPFHPPPVTDEKPTCFNPVEFSSDYKFQYFVCARGVLWRRSFDFKNSNHGDWSEYV